MGITEFGKINGEIISKYCIGNDNIKVGILDFGATICELWVKDKNGEFKDVVCGYDNIESYQTESGYLGATVGRYANRIANGRFSIDGKEYVLAQNNGTAHLHGGNLGYSHKKWNCIGYDDSTVILSLHSPDGDEGYPCDVDVKVTFTISDTALIIGYFASSSGKTVVNFTNHSYFNLNGYDSGTTILDHKLWMDADKYDAVNDALIPVGEPVPVDGTEYDFRTLRAVKNNYDTNFIINGEEYRKAAYLEGDRSGICVTVETDMPAIQIYTSGGLSGKPLKNNVPKMKYGAICLETQFSPDTPNRPYMPQCFIDKDDAFMSFTKFIFDVVK